MLSAHDTVMGSVKGYSALSRCNLHQGKANK